MLRTSHHWWKPAMSPAAGAAATPGTRVSFVTLMAFIVISLTAPQTLVPALASLRIALLPALVAIVALLIERFVHRRPPLTPSRETWLAACLAGWAIASVAFS